MIGWVRFLVLMVLVTMSSAGCAIAGGIFKAGAWVGALGVIVVIAIIGFVVAKARG